jgi:hypothetical protein
MASDLDLRIRKILKELENQKETFRRLFGDEEEITNRISSINFMLDTINGRAVTNTRTSQSINQQLTTLSEQIVTHNLSVEKRLQQLERRATEAQNAIYHFDGIIRRSQGTYDVTYQFNRGMHAVFQGYTYTGILDDSPRWKFSGSEYVKEAKTWATSDTEEPKLLELESTVKTYTNFSTGEIADWDYDISDKRKYLSHGPVNGPLGKANCVVTDSLVWPSRGPITLKIGTITDATIEDAPVITELGSLEGSYHDEPWVVDESKFTDTDAEITLKWSHTDDDPLKGLFYDLLLDGITAVGAYGLSLAIKQGIVFATTVASSALEVDLSNYRTWLTGKLDDSNDTLKGIIKDNISILRTSGVQHGATIKAVNPIHRVTSEDTDVFENGWRRVRFDYSPSRDLTSNLSLVATNFTKEWLTSNGRSGKVKVESAYLSYPKQVMEEYYLTAHRTGAISDKYPNSDLITVETTISFSGEDAFDVVSSPTANTVVYADYGTTRRPVAFYNPGLGRYNRATWNGATWS